MGMQVPVLVKYEEREKMFAAHMVLNNEIYIFGSINASIVRGRNGALSNVALTFPKWRKPRFIWTSGRFRDSQEASLPGNPAKVLYGEQFRFKTTISEVMCISGNFFFSKFDVQAGAAEVNVHQNYCNSRNLLNSNSAQIKQFLGPQLRIIRLSVFKGVIVFILKLKWFDTEVGKLLLVLDDDETWQLTLGGSLWLNWSHEMIQWPCTEPCAIVWYPLVSLNQIATLNGNSVRMPGHRLSRQLWKSFLFRAHTWFSSGNLNDIATATCAVVV